MQPKTWGSLLREFGENPALFAQQHWIWMISILALLFIISRLNNYLEVKGVDRAIYVTRGFVGTITAFVITPIAFIVLLNIIALLNGFETISLWKIWDWLKLTATSYWWLAKVFFGGGTEHEDMYNMNSIIRILWIVLPLTFVWFRITNSRLWRLLLIPFIGGVFFITQHKAAASTFMNPIVTKYIERWSWNNNTNNTNTYAPKPSGGFKLIWYNINEKMKGSYSKIFITGLFILLGLAIFIGLFSARIILGLIITITCLLGLFFVYNSLPKSRYEIEKKQETVSTKTFTDLYDLMHDFDSLYILHGGQEHLELYNKSVEITNVIDAKQMAPPPEACRKYKQYFYKYCN